MNTFEEYHQQTRWSNPLEGSPPPKISCLLWLGEKAFQEEQKEILTGLESLLAQSFTDWELIVFDQSQQGKWTKCLKQAYPTETRLIIGTSCYDLQHGGLAMTQSALMARGDFLFIAYGGARYHPQTLQKLLSFLEIHPEMVAVYDKARFFANLGYGPLGKIHYDYQSLCSYNLIGGRAVLVRKDFSSGLWDPHLGAQKVWDWDFWVRLGKEYPLNRLDETLLIRETKEWNERFWFVGMGSSPDREWMRQERNTFLSLSCINIYALTTIPPSLSHLTQKMLQKRLQKENLTPVAPTHKSETGDPLRGYVAVVGENSVSTGLYFDNLPLPWKNHILIEVNVPKREKGALWSVVLGARAVIFVRQIKSAMLRQARFLKRLGIPFYYYTDDNFFALDPSLDTPKVRRFLSSCKGILVSTPRLGAYFRDNGFHKNILRLRPLAPPTLLPKKEYNQRDQTDNNSPLHLVFGSANRLEAFCEMADGLKKLATKRPLHLHITSQYIHEETPLYKKIYAHPNISLSFYPFQISHNAYVRLFKDKPIDFFIHPFNDRPPYKDHYPYKSLCFFMNGPLTGALVLSANVAPYNTLTEIPALAPLLVNPEQDWGEHIENFQQTPSLAQKTFKSLSAFCQKQFDPRDSVETLKQIFAQCPPVSLSLYYRRKIKAFFLRPTDSFPHIGSFIKKVFRQIGKPFKRK